MQTNADRNLLLGILALQMDFISRGQLITAMNAWVLEKTRGIDQILLEQGALKPDTHALLVALVDKHLELHGGDAEQSLAAVSSIGSLRDELNSIGDEQIEATLPIVSKDHQSFDPHATETFATSAGNGAGQRFRILRPHAKGGLGEVSVAHDEELNREVALKEIQDRFADDGNSRARFVLEAEITGGLEHPGIVPVYGLGQYADGRPFYAMRFIRGDSLQEAADRFHQGNGADESERTLQLHKLLGRFVDVCNAIGYAHSRGVLHRDLKPGNIMLGKYGETLVVDWGLAKLKGRDERMKVPGETTLAPSSGSGSTPTQMGIAIGTPAFMPPEQAAGKLDQLGPASDVYSLGATLYYLLTGRQPIEGESLGELLRRVEMGEFARPREISPSVSKPLEAICLRAMATRPEDRYASPGELASDIECWLADEPVATYTPSLPEQIGRWTRRHRSWVLAGSVLLLLTAVGSIVSALMIERARRQAVVAKASEEEQRFAAEQARDEEKNQRTIAEDARREAEHTAYESDMLLAARDWESGDIRHLKELLDRHLDRDNLKGFEWGYWDRLTHSDLLTLKHTGIVRSVAFSPDGTRLASTSQDDSIKVWDAITGQETLSLKAHTGRVYSVAFSPDGTRLASTSQDETVKVWDAITGQETLSLKGHTGLVYSVAFSPDGTRLASTSQDETVKVWDATTGQETLTLKGHNGMVTSVAFSPDGTRLASASQDHTVKVWDATTGQETLTLKGLFVLDIGVTSIAFSPDGTRLALASGMVQVWDAITGQETLSLKGHTGIVTSVAFSPDGTRLASASRDDTVKVWDATTGQETLTLKGHSGSVTSVAFSPDGTRLASASVDKTVKVWDAITGQETLTLKQHRGLGASVAFSPDGTRLASASVAVLPPLGWDVPLWDATTGQQTLTLKGHTENVQSVVFSPDGTRLASASQDETVRVWDAATGQETLRLKGHTGMVTSVAFSPDGTRLASASQDETVKVWDATTGQETLTLKGHSESVTSVAFSPDGTRLASASDDKTVKLWDATRGRETLTLKGHSESVTSVAFSPDGTRLASASQDETVKAWDATTGQETLTLKGHSESVTSVAFSPDGTRLASASDDKTVKLWDATRGRETLTLKGHNSMVLSVAFSPDGTRLASACSSGMVKVWDARAWTAELRAQSQVRGLLTVHRDRVKSLEELRAIIRSDQTISDMVRKQALDWSASFWNWNNRESKRIWRETSAVLIHRGDVRLQSGLSSEALQFYQRGLAIRQEFGANDPSDAQAQRDLVVNHYKLGQANNALGDYAKAAIEYETAAAVLRRMINQAIDVKNSRKALAVLETAAATASLSQIALGEWGVLLEQPSELLPSLLERRAIEFAKVARFGEAAQAAAKLRTLKGTKASQIYNVACTFSLAAASIKADDGEELSAEQMQRRRQYIADAVATLKQAITAGWDDFAHIQRDPDLNILRELPEFTAILPQPIESDSKSDSDSADGKAKATGKQSTDAQKGSD